jgi:hypothetical protein
MRHARRARKNASWLLGKIRDRAVAVIVFEHHRERVGLLIYSRWLRNHCGCSIELNGSSKSVIEVASKSMDRMIVHMRVAASHARGSYKAVAYGLEF